jgi:hypothetical protein
MKAGTEIRGSKRDAAGAIAATLLALASAAALSCSNSIPDVRPPPFGPDPQQPQAARFFFPTGLGTAPAGNLLVVNGNFDHAFEGGTILSIRPDYLTQFLGYYDSSRPLPDPVTCVPDFNNPGDPCRKPVSNAQLVAARAFAGAAMIGSYGGPLVTYTNASGRVRAFTGSRDTNEVDSVQVAADGSLSCNGGGPADVDCRPGAFDTFNAACPAGACPGTAPTLSLEGPYGLALGTAQVPGSTAPPRSVLFVTSLVPHIDQLNTALNNALITRAPFAALSLEGSPPPAQPGLSLFYGANTSDAFTASGIGSSSLVFDPARRRLVLAGCYQRFPASNGSVPSSGKCPSFTGLNLLRFISVDEGANANVQVVDMNALVRSTETNGLALGGIDPADPAQVPRKLYATLRAPDLLVELDLTSNPGAPVRVARTTPLPISPGGLAVIQRPASLGGADIVAIAAQTSGTVTVFDTGSGQVVANLENLGTAPYTVVQLPSSAFPLAPAADPRAHMAVALFDNCRVALFDVPLARPSQSAVRALLGSCP